MTIMTMSQLDMKPALGHLVDRAVVAEGWTYGDAARRMFMSEPTLRDLRKTGNVSDRFYRKAEAALGFPPGLLLAMKTGDVARVRELLPSDKLTDEQRAVITAVIDPVAPAKKTARRSGKN